MKLTPATLGYLNVLVLAIIIGLFYSLFLGLSPLVVPDEARYAEIAREMLASGNYITPHLNGLVYLEKPILFFWMQSAFIKMFGLSEWALRSWNMLAGVLGCLVTYWAGVRLYRPQTAWYACFILATSLEYFVMSHAITVDMTLTLFLTISLYSFIIGMTQPDQRQRWFIIAGISGALAVLSKGLVGIILPGIIIFLWSWIIAEWRWIKSKQWIYGVLLFLIVVMPWHILVQLANPDFFHFYFIEQHFLRYATSIAHRYEPFYFYPMILIIGFFPWTAFLYSAIRHIFSIHWWSRRRNYCVEIFLLLWVLVVLIFFSFSQSKLIPYILPVFSPLALLMGKYFDEVEFKKDRLLYIGFFSLLIFSLIISISLLFLLNYFNSFCFQQAQSLMITLSILLVVISSGSLYIVWRHSFNAAFIWLMFGMGLCLVLALTIQGHCDYRSIKPLATSIVQSLKPSDKIVSYEHYFQDLPLYTQHLVLIAHDHYSGELLFGIQHAKDQTTVIDLSHFEKLFNSPIRLWVVSSKKNYEQFFKVRHLSSKPIYKIKETPINVLWSNKK